MTPIRSSGIPQVKSSTELERVRATLAAKFPNHFLLFRGQNKCYSTIMSGLSRPEIALNEAVEKSWSVIAGIVLGDEGVTHRSLRFRRALMQHYGLPTNYVDLTASIGIAAWFATNQRNSRFQVWGGEPPRLDEIIQYARRDQGVGVIIVFAIPDASVLNDEGRLFKLGGIDGLAVHWPESDSSTRILRWRRALSCKPLHRTPKIGR